MSAPEDVVVGALRDWLGYLRDLGVRELRVPVPPPVRSVAATHRMEPQPRIGPVRDTAPSTIKIATLPAPPPDAARIDLVTLLGATTGDDPALRLSRLREAIGECTRCKLHTGRTHVVFGVGDPHARLMFIGEGPGAEEDLRGEPFVGRAGKKLDDMMAAMGLAREQVYIANVVKCRPPNNRDPEPDEIATCSPFLFAQVEIVRPRVIVTLGAPATKLLLSTREGITKLRGNWQSFRGIPVMPTFHPAFLLRAYTRENRAKVWADLCAAKERLDAST
jgi:DNA polymerase